MRNRAHEESRDERLSRFRNYPPVESVETLLNSIDNYFNNEIALAPQNYQSSLLFLGIHAAILTIAEAFWDKGNEEGYRLFLEHFVDGETVDTQFSKIAELLHDWRNILAHQWISSTGHQIQYDYKMKMGWEKRGDITVINPGIYCDAYLSAFRGSKKLWDYEDIFSAQELEKIKERIIEKFIRN